NCKLPALSLQKEKGINNKLLIEELKLLFLKCRKLNSHVFNAIICAIYPDLRDKLHQETAKNIHHECVLKMADYRHKYVKKISEMVNTYIKDEEKVTVEEYIGDSWRNILSMHLRAIQKDEFESSKDDQEQLKKFVIESFKIVLDYELLDKDGADVDLPGDKIKKTLDHITLGIK
ncbi:20713_t:CDS:2, partial [Rhizophagus irregularis]